MAKTFAASGDATSSDQLSNQIVLFGIGDQAKVLHSYFSWDSRYEVVGFTVHEAYCGSDSLLGLPVVPFESVEETFPPSQFPMHVAMAFGRVNKDRAAVYAESKEKGYRLVSYVSSHAILCGDVELGDNCVLLEGVMVQPFAKIGNNVTIASGTVIGHDAVIEDHCFIAAHAVLTGRVKLGEYSFVGANATFRNEVTVAAECVIGAGAVVLKDTNRGEVYLEKATEVSDIPSDLLSPFFGAPRR